MFLKKIMNKPSVKYTKETSIVFGNKDEFLMTDEEFVTLYKFFVNKPIRQSSSNKSIEFIDYGWPNNSIKKNGLLLRVQNVSSYNSWKSTNNKDEFKNIIGDFELSKTSIITERKIYERIALSSKKIPLLIGFLDTMRNVFAHSNYWLCLEKGTKYIVFEDHFRSSITSRGIIKWDTVFKLIKLVKSCPVICQPQNRAKIK